MLLRVTLRTVFFFWITQKLFLNSVFESTKKKHSRLTKSDYLKTTIVFTFSPLSLPHSVVKHLNSIIYGSRSATRIPLCHIKYLRICGAVSVIRKVQRRVHDVCVCGFGYARMYVWELHGVACVMYYIPSIGGYLSRVWRRSKNNK